MIKSFVGGHNLTIFSGAEYDEKCRKYRGGTPVFTIPFSGSFLNANQEKQVEAAPLVIDGAEVPTFMAPKWISVDPIPDDVDFAIVSALYVAACKELGLDTSKLLTIGGAVVDEDNRVIGCIGLVRN